MSETSPAERQKERPALYPVGILLALMLGIFAGNTSDILQIYGSDFALSLLVALAVGSIVFWLTRLLIKNPFRAAILAFAINLCLMQGGDLFNVFSQSLHLLFLKITIKNTNQFLLLLLVALGGLGFLLSRLPEVALKVVHRFLNIVVLCLIAFPLITVGMFLVMHTGDNGREMASTPAPQSTGPVTKDLPDVYFIILDGYPNAQVLKAFYNFDNTPFLNALEKRGFYVASRSTSNYPRTTFSLSSTLNMKYIDFLNNDHKTLEDKMAAVQKLVNQNEVFDTFRQHGYQIVSFPFGATVSDKVDADLRIRCGGSLNEFTFLILKKTLAGLYVKQLNTSRRTLFQCVFNKVQEFALQPGPKFIFLHIVCPHRPFLFDRYGNPVEDASNLGDEMLTGGKMAIEDPITRKQFIEQVIYLNAQVIPMLDGILRNSKVPPIIVMEGDHGSPYMLRKARWKNPTPEMLFEVFSNLNAYRVPDSIKTKLYPEITPINGFPLILNDLFGTKIQPLPDENHYSVYSVYKQHHFELEDKTGEVREAWRRFADKGLQYPPAAKDHY